MARRAASTLTAGSPDDVKFLLRGALDELRTAVAEQAQKLFPNGIELIDVQVKVMNIEVQLKVAGPKAGTLLEGGQL